MDAGVGARVGNADVDDDGFIGFVDSSEVMDCGRVGDARDSPRMEVCDLRKRGVGVRLAKGFGGLLVVQARGEDEDVEPC